jgi:hemoglobin
VERPSIYEYAGGDRAFLALATAHHERCLADPVLEHPFSHQGNPEHVRRLADYWAEVFGGPDAYSRSRGGQPAMLSIHACQEGSDDVADEFGERFLACFLAAADDAGLPDDPRLREALRAYMRWAVRDVVSYFPVGARVPADATVPRWSWDGPVTA